MAGSIARHGDKFRTRWRHRNGQMQSFADADRHVVERFKLWIESEAIQDERDVLADDSRITAKLYLYDAGRAPATTGGGEEEKTFGDMARQWLAERQAEGVKDQSLKSYQTRVKRCKALLDLPLSTISDTVFFQWAADFRTTVLPSGKPYADNTVQETLAFAKAVLTLAHNTGQIGANPAARFKNPRVDTAQEDKFLSRAEYAVLRGYAPDKITKDIMDTMIQTGCRIGEVMGLRVDDLGFDGEYHTLRIDETTVANGYSTTKNRQIRVIDMSPALAAVLREYAGDRPAHEPIFRAPQGGVWDYQAFTLYRWNKMITAAITDGVRFAKGIPTTHWLRHSHAAWMLADEFTVYEISKRMGHSSIDITIKKYGHLVPEARRRNFRALGRIEFSSAIDEHAVEALASTDAA